jgi:CRISPR-associated protein Csd1
VILQALHEYYGRVRAAGDDEIAPPGWVRKPVDYVIHLTADGKPFRFESRFELVNGKRKSGRAELLPSIGKQSQKHTNSGDDANLLWDNSAFALGCGKGGHRKLESFHRTLAVWFPELHQSFGALNQYIQSLLSGDSIIGDFVTDASDLDLLATGAPIITFALAGDSELLCHRAEVAAAYERARSRNDQGPRGACLITGAAGVAIETNETVIKRVYGGQSSGKNIVSFNERAFESYGKTKRAGENAPISKAASFAYTTALNFLLREGSRNRVQVGDTSTVFWAEQLSDLEMAVPDLFGEPPKDDPDRGVLAVKALYSAIDSGRLAGPEGETRFYVLGLAPNAARIAIRFFHRLPLRELAARIRQHFDDLAIVHGPNDAPYPSLFRLLLSCAVLSKADNIPPNLGGAVVDAILEGPNAPYPAMLLNAAVNRCRTEHTVTHPRAAVIKASLNRVIRQRTQEEEFKEMLDLNNPNTAYRLGRLFAVLERIQEEAAGGPGKINATIKDRYYGAASSTPVAVFTTLLRLKNAHLKKLATGRILWFERLIGEVTSALNDFPPHLALPDQGRFALGYYHQRQAFFTKSDPQPTATTDTIQEGS